MKIYSFNNPIYPFLLNQPTTDYHQFSKTMNIPNPPLSTIQDSNNSEPRTLWMGDLDPQYNEYIIEQIWLNYNLQIKVKLIRSKRNQLIPISSIHNQSKSLTSIEYNGMTFIDPNVTQLHHAGYCFIEFNSFREAQFALSLNSMCVPNIHIGNYSTNPQNDRLFRLNWASGATLQSNIPIGPEYSIFVGDLDIRVTEVDLMSLFQTKYQSVKTARVMSDPLTGISRCFGFVRFENESERDSALIEMSQIMFKGRLLRVSIAAERPSHNRTVAVNTTTDNIINNASIIEHQDPGHLQPVAPANSRVSSNSRSEEHNHRAQLREGPSKNTTIFIGGLSKNITEWQVELLFKPFGNIFSIRIPNGRSCGFVTFFHKLDAQAAMIGMQGYRMNGRHVRLAWGNTPLAEMPEYEEVIKLLEPLIQK